MIRNSKLNTVMIFDLGDRTWYGVGNHEQLTEIKEYVKRRVKEEYSKPENIGSDWVVPMVLKEAGERYDFNGCGVCYVDMTGDNKEVSRR